MSQQHKSTGLLKTTLWNIINTPKNLGHWFIELIYIKNTEGFSISTGLFSFLTGFFLMLQLIIRTGFDVSRIQLLLLSWAIFATLAGAFQLYAVSKESLRMRQLASIIQILFYIFFLSLSILSENGITLTLIAILATQIILLTVSLIRVTQELNIHGH